MLLMHKDTLVAEVDILYGGNLNIKKIYNREHFPVGAFSEFAQIRNKTLENWQKMRAIPNERQNLFKILNKIDCTVIEAAMKNMNVSLTDCYWFKDDNSLTWNDVNYYDNGFTHDIGKIISGCDVSGIDYRTPDFTTDGALEKFWVPVNGVPTLIKIGNINADETYKNVASANEVVASKIATLMDINSVKYFKIKLNNGIIGAGCESFIHNSNEEFVNALQILKEYKTDLRDTFAKNGLSGFFDDMLVFDYIIGNTDRHEKNFGIIRNPETMEIISPAALFDNGSCLGWNGEYDINKVTLKPFNEYANKQLSMVGRIKSIPDIKRCQEIVEETYDDFEISKDICQKAKAEIRQNIENVTRVKQLSERSDEER